MSKIADTEANATSFDSLVNDNALVTTLRNGPKPSYQYLVNGWKSEFDLAIEQYKESRGFNTKGTFATGFTYELPNDVGLDADGNPWILIDASSLPVIVSAGTTPSNPPYKQVSYGTASQVSTNTSDTVQSFADSFALKIFQSPTNGGLTEIQTRTVDADEVYEVRQTSDGSLATIYSDAAGTTEIVQDGASNASDSAGVVGFYIGDGEYYASCESKTSYFTTTQQSPIIDKEYQDILQHCGSVGTKYNILSYDNAKYVVVNFSDTGGYYLPVNSSVKLKLIHNGDIKLSWLGEITDLSDVMEYVDSVATSVTYEGKAYPTLGSVNISSCTSHNFNGCKIDGSGIVDTSVDQVLSIKGDDAELALPSLSSDLVISDRDISFASAHGLVAGDWFLIYDPRDYSYSPARVDYRSGEYCQVEEVLSSTEVRVYGSILCDEGYESAEVEVYKVSPTRFSFEGSVEVIAPSTGANIRAISCKNTLDTDYSKFKAVANNALIGMVLSKCINSSGSGMTCLQSGEIGVGYGLALVSCQEANFSGVFKGNRHGFTTAETNTPSVVNRNLLIDGYFESARTDLAACDTHGNTEHATFTGHVNGGVQLRGNHLKVNAVIKADRSGRCVTFQEMTGYDHDLSGCTMIGSSRNSIWGIINVGYSGTVAAPDYPSTKGGLMNLKNVTIDAPNASLLVSILKKDSLATDVKVDLRGLAITNSQPLPKINLETQSIAKFEYLDLSDFEDLTSEITVTHSGLERLKATVKGFAGVVTDGDNRASLTVNVGVSFGTSYDPQVMVSNKTSGNVNTTDVDLNASESYIIPFGQMFGTTNSQITIGYGSATNDVMVAGQSRNINWVVS